MRAARRAGGWPVLRLHHQLAPRRRCALHREGSRVPESSRRWHLQGDRRHRRHRLERYVAVARRRLSVPDLRERLETSGLRRPAGWFARRDHQREYSVQQPTGLGGILIRAGYSQLRLCLQAFHTPPYTCQPVRDAGDRIGRSAEPNGLKLFEPITMLRCHATQLRGALSLRTSGRKGQRIRVLGRTTVR